MKKLLWLDLETTGLDEKKDRILEVAVIVTDEHLKRLAAMTLVVRQPQAALDAMGEWCKQQHNSSGLVKQVLSAYAVNLDTAESLLIAFMTKHFPGLEAKDDKPILAGNSIHFDRRFLKQHMPSFEERLHYRQLDVSSFKIWFGLRHDIVCTKKNAHRAFDDLTESIAEMQFYAERIQ